MAVPCFHLFVTNFVKEGQFLKVIGHKDRRTVKTVEQTILQSFQAFEKGNGVPDPASLRPGLMCCARYTDGAYYRVRVTHVDWTNGFCLVYFIDYGNGDRVAMADIRLVDPSSPVMRLPAQATSYFLAGVISTWDQMLLNHLKQLILYNELKAVVCQTIGQTDVVRLYLDGDKEFSDFLVRQGMATYVAPEAFESMVWRNIAAPTHPVSDAYPYAGYVSPVHQRPAFPVFSAVPPVVALQQPVMPSPPPPLAAVNMRATSFPTYPTLDKNSEHKVFVSHCQCDNGSVTFYAQLNTPEVEKLSNGLNNPASNFTNLSPPLFPGQLCVARYTEDEQLYRAVITDVTDKVSVYFVDYGNKDSVNPGSIYEIPSEYTHIQVMAIPLALANWEKVDWSNEVSEIVTAVINEQNATLKVSPSQELSTKQYCDLFIDETNVIELINVELLKRKPKLAFRNIPVPTAGGKVKVIVTFVKSLDNFYVQLSANEDDLNAMMELVKSHCNGPAGRMQPHEIQPGAACCALYKEDDEWYRGMITDASTDEPSVLYVDFGNIERVPIADLRVANEQIVSQLLTQAIPCRLPGFDGKPDDQLTARFKELAEGNTFTMHVLKLVEEVPYIVVRLFDDSREDILQKLQSAPIHQINGHTIAPPSNVKVAMGDSGAREVSIKLDCPKKDPAAWGLGIHQVNSNHNSNVVNNINTGHCDRVSNSKYHTESQVPERRHYVPRLITPDYSSILTIGDRKPVLISFSNGPSDFHVQFKPTAKFDSLGEQLEHSFADGGEVLDRSLVQIGTACVARYPVDEMFYRAEIKEVHNDGATVNFVDYGNIERVSFADLKKIPESLCQLPVQAFHCSLKGVPSSEDNIVKLDTFVESQSLEVELLELDGNLFHVILWDCNSPVSINEQCGALLSPESVSIADASVPLGCTEEVVVTYFKSLQYFCVMQMSVRNDFNSMMTNLQGSYQNKEPVASPSVGQSVVVRYSDGAFYRAKVLIQRDGKYGVICCDYGNKYLASPSHIFALEERYSGLPAAAIQCSFKEPIPKPTNSWATSDLSELLTGNLSCTFLSHSQMGYFVTCTRNGVDVLKPLIDACSPVEATPSVTVREIDVGSEHEVTLSYIVSPQEFYFHLKQEAEELEKLQQDLQAAAGNMSPLQGVPKPRELVMALYDDVWYRGRVTEDGCIYYCDYGNTEPFPDNKSDVRKIPANLQSRPDFAIKCCFADSQNKEWAPEAQEVLGNLLEEAENLSIQIKSVQQGLYCVDIPSVADKLPWTEAAVGANSAPAQDSVQPPTVRQIDVGSEHEVTLSYIVSPQEFYFHLKQEAEELEKLQQDLQAAAGNMSPLQGVPKPGELVMALYEDEWYRGRVTEDGCIYYCDYGNTEPFPDNKSDVRKIPADLQSRPDFAMKCCFAQSQNHKWMLNARDILTSLFEEAESFLIQIKSVQSGLFFVDIPSLSDKLPWTKVAIPTNGLKAREIHVGSEHEVTFSFIVSPQEFYLHLKQEAEELEKLQQDVQAAAGNMLPLQGMPKPGFEVMALYDDEWYRGRISKPGSVFFYDYGNTEDYDSNNVKPLPANLQSRPDFAIKCCFADSQNKEWAPEAQEVLGNLLEEAENLSIQIKSVQQGLYCVDIPSVADKLPWTEAAVGANSAPAQDTVQPPTVRQIGVGSEHEVTLSYIVSPQEFFFHLKQEAEELEKLQQDLQAAAGNMSPLQGVPKPGELVMALYDDVWYRGRVTEDGCIYYCDYGNTEPFPDNKSDVRKIPADLQSRPDFAIKCCFADSQNKEWAPEAQEVLGNLLEEAENLSIQIKSVQQGLYCVDIPSVADKLPWTEAAVGSNTPPAQANLSGRLEALSIDEGGVKATIVDYTSPDDFYIHLESDADKLTQMAQRLVEADLFKTSESWAPGESCAALFLEDNLWYRATIVSSAPPHHKVRFVDYGNEAVTHAVRILPEDLINDKQPLAYHCAIPRPKDLSWVDEAKEKMRAFVDNETKLLVEFLNCNPEDGLYLVNIKSGDVDVNEELARASGFDHLVTSRKILSCNMEAQTDISHVADTHVLSTIQEVTDDIENASEGCQRLSLHSPEKAVEDARIGDNETMVQQAAEERHVADVMFITSSNSPNSELSAVTDSDEMTTSLETVIEVCQKFPVAGHQEPDEVVILTNDISPMVQEVTEDTTVCSSVEVSIPSSTDVSNCDADDTDIANTSVETVIEVCQTLPGDGQQESDEVVIFTNDILPMVQEVTEDTTVCSLVEVSIPSSTEVSNCDADDTDKDEVTITSSTNMSNCDAIDDASVSVETTTGSCEDLSIPQRSDQVDIISDVLPTLQEVTEEVLVCATDEVSITSSTHLSNGDTEVCDTTHSSVESLIQGCQNLCIDDQKHDQAATDACEESSDEVEIVYDSLSTIPVITIYDSEDDMKKLDEISLVVPEEKRNLSEDYIVSLDTYSRYQALELNEGGTCHGFVKATMQDFPVLSEINPGRTIYLFNDCEKHTVTVNVTST